MSDWHRQQYIQRQFQRFNPRSTYFSAYTGGGLQNPSYPDPSYSDPYRPHNRLPSAAYDQELSSFSREDFPDYADLDDDHEDNDDGNNRDAGHEEIQPTRRQGGAAAAAGDPQRRSVGPFQTAASSGPTAAMDTSTASDPAPIKESRQTNWDVFYETDLNRNTSHSEIHTWKVANAVLRIVAAVLFFFLILGAALAARLILLVMTYNLRPGLRNFTLPEGRTLKAVSERVDLKWVWSLMVVMAAPYLFAALTSLWTWIFKKTEPLKCGPLMVCLLAETLHSLGLCTMVFYVLPSFDPVIGCLLLLNVAFMPGLIQTLTLEPQPQPHQLLPEPQPVQGEDAEAGHQKAKKDYGPQLRVVGKFLDVLMLFFHLGAMLVWSCRAYVVMQDVTLAILTPVSMALTSVSWWDNYVSGRKERRSGPRAGTSGSTQAAGVDVQQGSTTRDSSHRSLGGEPGTAQNTVAGTVLSMLTGTAPQSGKRTQAGILTRLKRSIKKRRTKITLLTSLWKLAVTIAFPALAFGDGSKDCIKSFFFFYDAQNTSPQPSSLNQTVSPQIPLAVNCSMFKSLEFVDEMSCHAYYPFLLAAVHVLCSIICYKMAKSACKVLLQVPSFAVPLGLVTPVALILLVASYLDTDDFHSLLGCRLPWVQLPAGAPDLGPFLREMTLVYWVPAGLAAYLSLHYFTLHVWRPKAERMARTDKLFSKPFYCAVLLEQSLLLNRRRDEDDPADHSVGGKWTDKVQELGDKGLEEARSALRTDTTPLIYICATMWHESEAEMIMMLKSVFRLDVDQSARKNAQLYFNIVDPDYYEFEAHIFFDDAYQGHADDDFEYTVNNFVKQLVRVVDAAASAVHNMEMKIPKPRRIPTPYGGRLVWTLPGGNILTGHLKDKAKIRHRKRWSQVMYMYYFLGYKLLGQERLSLSRKKLRAENTFLLALDGDVDFQPEAVQILVDRMKQTPELGAACGRIHPIGSGPMVWYQKFEYAVSHWLQKSTEHVLGCVLCSPGCFSLFRGSALMDDNVMKRYTTPPTEARHYVQYDQGEDRWLCTLLLQQGHRVEYCAASDSYTFAPEGFYEFYNQRRRWTPSTMANIIDLLGDWKNTTKNNQDISVLYIIYQTVLLASGIVTPGTIFLLIVGAISNATQDSIPLWAGMLLNAVPIFIFVVLCFKADTDTQLAYAGVLSIVYTIVMMLALVGIIRGAALNGFCSVSTTFLLAVAGIFVLTALLHPMESMALLHGGLYFLTIPSTSMLLLLYSLANLHNVSWGTREVKSAAPPPPNNQFQHPAPPKSQGPGNFLKEALAKLTDTNQADSDYALSFGNLFRCLCCPRQGASPNDLRLQAIMKSIEVLNDKVSQLSMTSGVGSSLQGVEDLPEDTPPASPTPESLVPARVNQAAQGLTRDELRNPMWADDTDLGNGQKEFLDKDEVDFWTTCIGQYLYPLDKDEKHEQQVKAELLELRNKMSLAFLLINTLFVVLISSLQIISEKTTNLSVEIPCGRNSTFTGEKIEPISVTFTLVFGIMLIVQFLAMLFHRYSTLLHIISITEIKFKKLTRQVLGMEPVQEEEPSVEETIALAREMQALRPPSPSLSSAQPEPEADYDLEEGVDAAQDDDGFKTPDGTQRRKGNKELWSRLGARRRRPAGQQEQTLGRAFLRNYEKLAHQIRLESSAAEYSGGPPPGRSAGGYTTTTTSASVRPIGQPRGGHALGQSVKNNVQSKFRHMHGKSVKTMVRLASDSQYKEHILRRSQEARTQWRRALAKLRGGKFQFRNVVQEARQRKEEEDAERMEEEEDERQVRARQGRYLAPPTAAGYKGSGLVDHGSHHSGRGGLGRSGLGRSGLPPAILEETPIYSRRSPQSDISNGSNISDQVFSTE